MQGHFDTSGSVDCSSSVSVSWEHLYTCKCWFKFSEVRLIWPWKSMVRLFDCEWWPVSWWLKDCLCLCAEVYFPRGNVIFNTSIGVWGTRRSQRTRRTEWDRATLSTVICCHLFPLLTRPVIENTSCTRKTFLSTQPHAHICTWRHSVDLNSSAAHKSNFSFLKKENKCLRLRCPLIHLKGS